MRVPLYIEEGTNNKWIPRGVFNSATSVYLPDLPTSVTLQHPLQSCRSTSQEQNKGSRRKIMRAGEYCFISGLQPS